MATHDSIFLKKLIFEHLFPFYWHELLSKFPPTQIIHAWSSISKSFPHDKYSLIPFLSGYGTNWYHKKGVQVLVELYCCIALHYALNSWSLKNYNDAKQKCMLWNYSPLHVMPSPNSQIKTSSGNHKLGNCIKMAIFFYYLALIMPDTKYLKPFA